MHMLVRRTLNLQSDDQTFSSVYIDSFTFYPKPKLLYNLYGEHLDLGRRLVFGGNYTVGSSLQLVST